MARETRSKAAHLVTVGSFHITSSHIVHSHFSVYYEHRRAALTFYGIRLSLYFKARFGLDSQKIAIVLMEQRISLRLTVNSGNFEFRAANHDFNRIIRICNDNHC